MEGINDINQENSINYTNTRKLLNKNEMKSIDEIFSYTVACEIINDKDDPEPKSVM